MRNGWYSIITVDRPIFAFGVIESIHKIGIIGFTIDYVSPHLIGLRAFGENPTTIVEHPPTESEGRNIDKI